MKKAISIIIISLICFGMQAQGIFNQKGAWIKNQIKQIALLQVYINDIKKGYDIARDGLAVIGNIKKGDFHLHQNHFNSLVQVNPAIRKYSKAVGILVLQGGIKKLCAKNEDDYVNAVYKGLVEQVDSEVAQLNMLLSPGNYSLTDDERIQNIDRLYDDMKDNYAFAKSFATGVIIRQMQQLKEKNEIRVSQKLNNIKLP